MEKKIERNYWQEGSGDGNRDYVDICLNFGVILNGPGYAGPYPECSETLLGDGRTQRKVTDIKRFAEDMKEGDIVALRTGTKLINAVGIIVGEYSWNKIFSDVDGWDIQHVRRVRWLWRKNNEIESKTFETGTVKWGDTTQILNNPEVKNWIDSLKLDYNDKTPLPILPIEDESVENISIEAIGEYLYDKGASSNSIERLEQTIDDLHMIAKWYLKQEELPSESETKTYLVIPLLRALGWTPQKMAIEWKADEGGKKADIALFCKLPRNKENLIAMVEAKKKDSSCLIGFKQVQEYAEGKLNCNRLIVTDGLRYGIYIKENEQWKLYSYMNLTTFKDEYKIINCKGIREALWLMTPEWNN